MEKRAVRGRPAGSLKKMFIEFLRFGCFTFGGGWSIISQMQELYVEKEHSMTDKELLDLASVSRSLPGVMIGNVAMLYGYRIAGLIGGLVCVLGLAIAPLTILSIVTYCYSVVRSNPWVMAAMNGIRAAVVPIMISAALGMIRGAFQVKPCVLVALITFCLYLFLDVNCVWLVLIGAVSGLLLSEYVLRKGEELP